MGRKKKLQGSVLPPGPLGRPLRYNARIQKGPYPSFLHQKQPRGKTAKAWWFTSLLKERVPLVYVFVVSELKLSRAKKDPSLQKIIDEARTKVGMPARPRAGELTAYLIERAFDGAWAMWGVQPPYRDGDGETDSFTRRYVHGHADAIKDFRIALSQPKPWDRFHVGHDLKYFLKEPGAAAKHYKVLELRSANLFVTEIKDV